jgi:hypothetical protein
VMFNVFKEELEKRNIPFKLVKGSYQQRQEFVRTEIDNLLQQ